MVRTFTTLSYTTLLLTTCTSGWGSCSYMDTDILLFTVCLLIKQDANLICGVDARTVYLSISAWDYIEVVQHSLIYDGSSSGRVCFIRITCKISSLKLNYKGSVKEKLQIFIKSDEEQQCCLHLFAHSSYEYTFIVRIAHIYICFITFNKVNLDFS